MNRRTRVLAISALMIMTILACNFPTAANKPSPIDAQYTAAAETVAAIQTLNALLGTVEATQSTVTVQPTETPTITPSPTVTNTRQPTAVPTTIMCDRATFVADITIPDGTELNGGDNFSKTWRLMNNGSCTWTTDYKVVFDRGDKLGAPDSINMPKNVLPGQSVDISIAMNTPSSEGTYKGYWMLRNASGNKFGWGVNGDQAFWVEIKSKAVATGTTEIFNFVAQACDSETSWYNASNNLPCPGSDSDAEGFVIVHNNPKLETGSNAGAKSIETHPQWIDGGLITGKYETIDIKSGYRFRAKIGCLYKDGGSACDVVFRIRYRADGGASQTLGEWNQTYDGSVKTLDINLDSLKGKNVEFRLVVDANGSSGQDWAVWVNPRIVK